MPVEKPRVQFLESIRGIAALMVVFYHSVLAFWPFATFPDLPEWKTGPWPQRLLVRTPLSACYSGPFAVVIFFVLSGLVLSFSYFRRQRPESVTSAALRRYFRLAVPVLLAVLFAYALLKHRMYHNASAGWASHSAWLRQNYDFKPHLGGVGSNSAIWQGLYGAFFSRDASYDSSLWTMSVELDGSLLVFAFLALFGRVRNRWILYSVLGAILLGWQQIYLLDFLLGTALCDAYVRFELRQRAFDLRWCAWPLLLIGIWFGSRRWLPTIPSAPPIFVADGYSTIGALLVVGTPLFSAPLRRLMSSRPLALLGRASFGLYLLHVPILCSVGSAVYLHLRQARGFSPNDAAAAAVVVIVSAGIAGGWVMYFVADLPAVSLGYWIVHQLFEPSSVMNAVPAALEAPTTSAAPRETVVGVIS